MTCLANLSPHFPIECCAHKHTCYFSFLARDAVLHFMRKPGKCEPAGPQQRPVCFAKQRQKQEPTRLLIRPYLIIITFHSVVLRLLPPIGCNLQRKCCGLSDTNAKASAVNTLKRFGVFVWSCFCRALEGTGRLPTETERRRSRESLSEILNHQLHHWESADENTYS